MFLKTLENILGLKSGSSHQNKLAQCIYFIVSFLKTFFRINIEGPLGNKNISSVMFPEICLLWPTDNVRDVVLYLFYGLRLEFDELANDFCQKLKKLEFF